STKLSQYQLFKLFIREPLVLFAPVARADESPTVEAIKAALAKSLPLLEAGAKGSMEERKRCFTCHNQGLPIMALTTARARGLAIDDAHLQTQLQFTAEFLTKNKERYLEGKGQGGQVDTAGYALWTLDNGGWQPDETTAAVAEYFLQYQQDGEHWRSSSRRPPSEQSPFTSSYVALRGLKVFGTSDQRKRIDKRFEQVGQWLQKTAAEDTEDRVFRLRALDLSAAPEEAVRAARTELLETQRTDGGWSQLENLKSDAYATGSALVTLHQAGGLATDDAAYRRGLSYLISCQQDDGSWHVASRSKPFQAYFESGYPHGKDQFISIAAAGWATTALALALPEQTAGLLFREGFDDARLAQRGWYDGDRFAISAEGAHAGKGCIEYHWKADSTRPDSSSGMRRLFEPTETVYLRCYVKLSKGWRWTGRSYHPHLMHFMTTENGKYHGPAASHLTVYIEPQEGKLRLAAQDIQNKDAPQGLTQGPLRGGYNGKFYDSQDTLFGDDQWHCIEAMFRLNSLDRKADKPNADGIVRGWFDGKLVVDRTDVILRSTDFPKMKFNQFLLTPYFGPGLLPQEQSLWIDELAVGTERLGPIKRTIGF
ncbi:MAG: prenyltransferase/squalene oxidase repeat-containing protein, partial [Pirellulales bacterium]